MGISAHLYLRSIFDRPHKGAEWRMKFKRSLRTHKWTELRSNSERIVLGVEWSTRIKLFSLAALVLYLKRFYILPKPYCFLDAFRP